MTSNRRIEPSVRLSDCKERPLNVHVALPLHGRLDALLERLEVELGVRAYRRDLIAALILDAPEEAATLDEMIRRLGVGTAGDALVSGYDSEKILTFRSPGPGRRPHKKGA